MVAAKDGTAWPWDGTSAANVWAAFLNRDPRGAQCCPVDAHRHRPEEAAQGDAGISRA
jgi:hypothetical protein